MFNNFSRTKAIAIGPSPKASHFDGQTFLTKNIFDDVINFLGPYLKR